MESCMLMQGQRLDQGPDRETRKGSESGSVGGTHDPVSWKNRSGHILLRSPSLRLSIMGLNRASC